MPSILFLDVDGVLNDTTFLAARKWRGVYGMICRKRVAMLNRVVERASCQIVVSSAWRSDSRFRAYFRGRGARVRFHSDWRTGRISDGRANRRGREIAEWLERHPEVTRYAIVDDDCDMLPEQKQRFVQTSAAMGLRHGHCNRLVRLLAPPSPLPQSTNGAG